LTEKAARGQKVAVPYYMNKILRKYKTCVIINRQPWQCYGHLVNLSYQTPQTPRLCAFPRRLPHATAAGVPSH